jgi:hypothetical protein
MPWFSIVFLPARLLLKEFPTPLVLALVVARADRPRARRHCRPFCAGVGCLLAGGFMVSIDFVRLAARSIAACALAVAAAVPVSAQGVTVSGRLFHSVTLKPVENATVVVEGTKLETKSGADGAYVISGVPAGTYHLLVVAPGFIPSRVDLTVGATAVALDVAVDPELHYTEVVSVSPDARDRFDSYQPTTVLTGQDLSKQLQGTLGSTSRISPAWPSVRLVRDPRGRSFAVSTAIAC